MFATKLSLQDRIERTHAQLTKAKKNRTRAAKRAKKLKAKLERLVAKREAENAAAPLSQSSASEPISDLGECIPSGLCGCTVCA